VDILLTLCGTVKKLQVLRAGSDMLVYNTLLFPSAFEVKCPKLPIGHESEFRDMNQFAGIGIVSLEFRLSPEAGVIT